MRRQGSTKAASLEMARFLHAEQEWRDYKTNLDALNGVINGTVEIKDLRSEGTRLSANRRLDYMTKVLEAIDKVYDESPTELKEFTCLMYWSNPPLTLTEVAEQMGISRKQVLQWKKAIILKTQVKFGWR